MSYKSLIQYIELCHYGGINDFFLTPDSLVSLSELKIKFEGCSKCSFSSGQNKFIFGDGKLGAKCFVIGDPPNDEESVIGYPFVGKIGELFDNLLNKLAIKRNELYITNITKCKADNVSSTNLQNCLPILNEQIDLLKPNIILIFGLLAANTFFMKNESLGYYRQNKNLEYDGIPVFVTYSLSELLENTSLRYPAWDDMQLFKKKWLSIN